MGYAIKEKEGYMGAYAWEGENSHKSLYGSDLSKAIRAELKANGIKGVTVSCKHADHLYLKFKVSDADFKPFEEFAKEYDYRDLGYWIYIDGENKHRDCFFELDGEKQSKVLVENAKREYDRVKTEGASYDSGYGLNHHHLDSYKMFTDEFIAKVKKVKMIVNSYNYDNSNSMVDYFDRGFYENYSVKYAA